MRIRNIQLVKIIKAIHSERNARWEGNDRKLLTECDCGGVRHPYEYDETADDWIRA